MEIRKLILIVFFSLVPFQVFADYKVFYLPLGAETFLPVTHDLVEQHAEVEFLIKSKTLDKIFSVNKYVSKKSLLDTQNFRGKFVGMKSGRAIFLDQTRRFYDTKGELLVSSMLLDELLMQIDLENKKLCLLKKLPAKTRVNCRHFTK